MKILLGRHGGSQLRGPRFDPDLGLMSVWRFSACSPCVRTGFYLVLRFSSTPTKHASRSIGYSKLPLGVNVCMNGALRCPGIPSGVYSPLMPSVPVFQHKVVTDSESIEVITK